MTCERCAKRPQRTRGLCHNCYSYWRERPESWPDILPARRRVPVAPLDRAIAQRGGFTECARRAGLTGKVNRERDRLSVALRRARRRGWLTEVLADDMALTLLGETLDEIEGMEAVA